ALKAARWRSERARGRVRSRQCHLPESATPLVPLLAGRQDALHPCRLRTFVFSIDAPARARINRNFRYGPISAPVTASTEQTVRSVSSFILPHRVDGSPSGEACGRCDPVLLGLLS